MPMGASEGGNNAGVVRVWLLGGFRVSVGFRTIGEHRWQRRKAAALVKLLALAPGHRMHREHLMDLLWPRLGAQAAANNLHRNLYVARRNLDADPLSISRCLTLHGEQLSLCPGRDLWVDVEAFEQAAEAARYSREPAAYRAAIDLYAGELLPEDRYEEWAEEHRGRLGEIHLSLLLSLAHLQEEREDHDGAAETLGEVLAEDPVREEAHVGLMRLHALRGRQGEALRQYERLEEVLIRELGMQPSVASHALRGEIAAKRFPPPNGQPRVVSEPASPSEGRREDGGESSKHNLPVQRTSFVDREREMLELKRELAMTRLLTLTGTGGIGKTRLAQEVARDLVGAYPDGVWLVGLAGLREPKPVEQVVAGTLGVHERPGRPLGATLAQELRAKNLLLVMDNCEHLIEAVARFTDELLDACPKLRILATSREPLRVPGEVVRQLSPLPVPKDRALLTEEGLARLAVTRLFLDRAHRRKDDSPFFGRDLQAVVRICRRLEGIPLAIELAAARTAALSVEQIDERLEDSLGLLTTGFRSAPQRHRTLRATLDWSYALLSETERNLLGRLSVFAGGFSLEAAEALGSDEGVGEGEVLDPLSRLVEKSLVTLEEGQQDETIRYTMLEPVRQYARQKLKESGQDDAAQEHHADYFLALAEEAESELSGPNQETWLKRLEREHANLRAALAWALDPAHSREPTERRTELGLRLAGALGRFWGVYGPHEGLRWLERGLARGGVAPKPALAKALYEAGWIELFRGDYESAIALLEEGLTLFRELGDRRGVATSLVNLGFAALHLGNKERAAALRREVEELQSEPLDRFTLAWLTTFLALATAYEGDYERSAALAGESLAIYRELGDKRGVSLCHIDLGFIELIRGDHERAAGLLEESLRVLGGSEDMFCLAYGIFGLAAVAGARREPGRAARLWGAAESLREEIGVVSLTQWELQAYDYEGRVSAARNMLGDDGAWEEVFAQGRAMSAEEAVEYALSQEVSPATLESPPADRRTDAPLTRREREVAALVALGLANHQIAQELHLSERTVENHVSKILRKLGLASRTQVATWATEQRLLVDSNTDQQVLQSSTSGRTQRESGAVSEDPPAKDR
jgi:predicted ATPase/DNA-binding SARP family transcriptional activator/DNA-binding CsgD family transcriptional regulator